MAEYGTSEFDRRVGAARRQVAALPLWRGPVAPKELRGGITNLNFLVEDSGRKVVVRIGGDIEAHGIVRRNELAAARAAAAAGVAPPVVYAGPGVLVTEYIRGRPLTPDDVRKPENLPRLVALIRRAHRETPRHLRGPGVLFWVFHVIRDYEHALLDDVEPGLLQRLVEQARELAEAVGPIELVFGHNDLLAANFIDDGNRLWLVDWEYAGFNSSLFDLSGLSSNSDMPLVLREQMLEVYYERPVTDELRCRFAAMTAASLLRETMWSMVSELHAQLDFDYGSYTSENFARFEKAYNAFTAMDRP